MDISALLLSCSLHTDDALLLSIASVQSRGDAYTVIDVSAEAFDREESLAGVRAPSSPGRAPEAVARLLADGGEPVLGLLPTRPDWALEFGKTLEDLFDPCVAIAVASAKLSEFDHACRQSGRGGRGCILDLYGKGLGLPALRRAVLADLTLPCPFPTAGAESNVASDVPIGSDLFFSTTRPEPGSPLGPSPIPLSPFAPEGGS